MLIILCQLITGFNRKNGLKCFWIWIYHRQFKINIQNEIYLIILECNTKCSNAHSSLMYYLAKVINGKNYPNQYHCIFHLLWVIKCPCPQIIRGYFRIFKITNFIRETYINFCLVDILRCSYHQMEIGWDIFPYK